MNLRKLYHPRVPTAPATVSTAASRVAARMARLAGRAAEAADHPVVRAAVDGGYAPTETTPATIRKMVNMDDMRRVLLLPRVDYSNPPDFTDELLIDPNNRVWPDGEPVQLRPVQNQMLMACKDANGGLFFAGTGCGKSYAAILVGSVMRNVERVLIFTPAGTRDNLLAEYFKLRTRFRVLPSNKLFIYTTESLQKPRTEEEGNLIMKLVQEGGGSPATTLLVIDEAHYLKNLKSARGSRFMHSVLEMPDLRVVAMSGTMTNKSLHDAAHIAWYALRDGSPFPVQYGGHAGDHSGHRLLYMESLAACIDVDGQPTPDDWKQVAAFLTHYYPRFLNEDYRLVPGPDRISLMRQAFQKHLEGTRGVVITRESSLQGVSLVLEGLHPPMPPEILKLIADVEAGTDPQGMPIADAMGNVRVMIRKQLTQGFYYRWKWPNDVPDLHWKAARSLWSKMVRDELDAHRRTGYDSELLVYMTTKRKLEGLCLTSDERAWVDWVARSKMDGKTWEGLADPSKGYDIWKALRNRAKQHKEVHLLVAWLDWSAIEKHKPEPPTVPVWVSDFLIDHAVAWARQQERRPILWYEHRAVGDRLAARGIPAFGAGTNPPAIETVCALSIHVHKEGKNLQHWSNQAVLSSPSNATVWEQFLARTYRPGQKSECVRCYVYQHDSVLEDAINNAREGAAYAQDVLKNPQKLMFATYGNIKRRKVTYQDYKSEEDLTDDL